MVFRMRINTRVFGEVDIEDSKIIHFPSGIIGFPDLTDFALTGGHRKSIMEVSHSRRRIPWESGYWQCYWQFG